jgi:hypothetical protein
VVSVWKRRGSRLVYTAVLASGTGIPKYQPVSSAVYPTHFEGPNGPAPPFGHLPHGCYKKTWWGWDVGQNRKVLIAREQFPIFAPGEFGWRERRCEGKAAKR